MRTSTLKKRPLISEMVPSELTTKPPRCWLTFAWVQPREARDDVDVAVHDVEPKPSALVSVRLNHSIH
jgi:hypothetical protein